MKIDKCQIQISMTLGEIQSLLGLTMIVSDEYMYEGCSMLEEDVAIVHSFNQAFGHLVGDEDA